MGSGAGIKLLGDVEVSVSPVRANGKFVAVTGADGFIGSHIVKILLGKGYMVRGTVQDLDPAKVGFLKLLPQADENLSLFKGELLDKDCFDDVFRGCDCVFHLASPTLKHQREMKSPETDMIDQGVNGMRNVLQSCKIAGVKAVVITSSLCAASPKPDRPRMINESHWADPEVQMKKGAYHSAAKTLAERAAVEFLANMPTESAFRLVRICPAFTVGPMLQPTVNSSMERFAAMCSGGHHQRIRNDSISMIDVRDTAAHHVAAYEKGLEGRFFSTAEAWHWTLIYKALELHCPHIKDWPMPLPRGTKIPPVREYSKTRMNVLGVKERSMLKLLGDAAKELELKQLFTGFTYFEVAGYYDLGSGNGEFLMVGVTERVDSDGSYTTFPQISYVIGSQTEPAVYQLQQGALLGSGTGDFVLRSNVPGKPILDLSFNTKSGRQQIAVNGSIDGTQVSGHSYITSVGGYVYNGTYATEDGSETVTFAFGPGNPNSITFSDGAKVEEFDCDPIKRRFSWITVFNEVEFQHRLYINVDQANGLLIRYVQFASENPKTNHSTKVYCSKRKVTNAAGGTTTGASIGGLATFAGYYPLNYDGSTFVSIGFTEAIIPGAVVGVCTDGSNSTHYSSFTFQNNTLTFPDHDAPSMTFDMSDSDSVSVNVALPDGSSFSGENQFSVAPLKAFGYRTLTTSSKSTTNATLSITSEGKIVYTMDDAVIFSTTDYLYDPVQQAVFYDNFRLNFCYNSEKGVTCGVTKTTGGFNSILYAYP